jgi:pimeloyl-ACP methyl ester carboxylesterase
MSASNRAWGNGTGVMDATTYAFFNSNAASWGMVVAAAQEDNAGSGNFHKAGIDYLLKQNADAGSMFYKKLSTRAGVAGHSQGGFGATIASMHPNVEALVSVAGGGVPKQGVATMCLTGTKDQVEATATTSSRKRWQATFRAIKARYKCSVCSRAGSAAGSQMTRRRVRCSKARLTAAASAKSPVGPSTKHATCKVQTACRCLSRIRMRSSERRGLAPSAARMRLADVLGRAPNPSPDRSRARPRPTLTAESIAAPDARRTA